MDNDLFGTDHTPGYASAARFTALSVLQSGTLARDMRKVDQYTIYQSIGRDAGWLTASSCAGKRKESDAPHILIIPERPVNKDKFLKKVKDTFDKYGWVSIACGEGAVWEDHTPISASTTKDKFGNTEFGAMGGSSVALNLHKLIKENNPEWRGEFLITESLPMCAQDRASELDIQEAFDLGSEAVRLAISGMSGVMTCLERVSSNPYKVKMGSVPIDQVAVVAKPMPDDFITEDGFGVTDKFMEYLKPLVGELPQYVEIEKKLV